MADKDKTLKERRFCPYCDEKIAEAAFPYCEACGLQALRCPKCGLSVPRDKKICPNCGTDLKKAAAEGS